MFKDKNSSLKHKNKANTTKTTTSKEQFDNMKAKSIDSIKLNSSNKAKRSTMQTKVTETKETFR